MAKSDKMQRVVLGMLTVMLATSLALAVMAFAVPGAASAAPPPPQPDMECFGFYCQPDEWCAAWAQVPFECCDDLCNHPVYGWYCRTGWWCCSYQDCPWPP